MQNPNNSAESNETVILIANNVNNAVIFKDLTIQALDNPIPPVKSNTETANAMESLFPTVSLSILLVATLSVTLVYVNKKRQGPTKRANSFPADPSLTELIYSLMSIAAL